MHAKCNDKSTKRVVRERLVQYGFPRSGLSVCVHNVTVKYPEGGLSSTRLLLLVGCGGRS